jgi:WD40 repeat protein
MRLLTGYNKPLVTLAVSPDGRRLFSAAKGQSMVWEWDLPSGEVRQKLRGNRRRVTALAVTPDGKWLVAAESWYGVLARPLDGGEPVRFDHSDGDRTATEATLSMHPDGKLVATPWFNYRERAQGFALWDVATGKKVKAVKGHAARVEAVALSPDGTLLAAADGPLLLWDLEAAQVRHQHPGPAHVLAFRHDGKVLVIASGRSMHVLDVESGQQVRALTGQAGAVSALAYSPDGKYLASAGQDGAVTLFDSQTHEVVGRRHLEIGPLGALCWLPDSRGLIVGGGKPIAVCELAELLVQQEKPRPRGEPLSLRGHKTKVTGLAYSADGRALASWDRYGRRRFWDMSGGAGQAKEKAAWTQTHHTTGPTSWSPDGERVAVEGWSWGCLAEAQTGKVIREFERRGSWIRYLSFTSSGRVFLVWTDHNSGRLSLSLRDAASDEVLSQAEFGPVSRAPHVRSFTFGEGDQRVYFVPEDRSVACWTPATGEVVAVVRQHTQIQQLTVSADERLIATAGGNSAYVWSLPDGKKTAELKHPLACSGAEFLPHGRLLTSCNDGLVRVWDLSSGAELHAFDLGMGRVYSLAVSPDHMTFAAGVHKGDRIVLMDVPE